MTEANDNPEPAARPDDDASPAEIAPAPPGGSETVGTGSYIALSCSVMALLVTILILGILFLLRWF